MTSREVLELLDNPDSREYETVEGVEQVRWTYRRARRVLIFQNERLVSIVVR